MEYGVQILVVRECTVEADDDLQAERLAYQSLNERDQGAAIALCVLERCDNSGVGALAEEPIDCWRFAKENFNALDRGWVAE